MQKEIITDRLMPGIIRDICAAHGFKFESFSDDWLLRLENNEHIRWVVGSQFDINLSASAEIARDKVATYTALSHANVPAIQHVLARTRGSEDILEGNLNTFLPSEAIVAKPLLGNSGIGVKLCHSLDAAVTYISSQSEPSWAVSPWYDISTETRIIVLDGHVLHTYKKTEPYTIDGLKFFNLGHGSQAINISPSAELSRLAIAAQHACGLRLCAVDVASLADGQDLVMEINEHFGMEYYARASDENYQKTYDLYDKIVTTMMTPGFKNETRH